MKKMSFGLDLGARSKMLSGINKGDETSLDHFHCPK